MGARACSTRSQSDVEDIIQQIYFKGVDYTGYVVSVGGQQYELGFYCPVSEVR